MSEYIGRESIRKSLMEVCSDENCPMFIAATIDQVIDYEPAADVAPVVHAYWIYQKPYDEYTWRPYICSSCKTHGGKHRTNYCQSCGAKMDGKERQNNE
jgi:hypothetical protein